MMLEIRDLTIVFKNGEHRLIAADKVDLSVERGSFAAIVGESGSGKSVTALSICRLLRAHEISGSIFWNDGAGKKDLMKISEDELRYVRGRQIAYIFQDPASSLNPVIKVGEQLSEVYLTHFDSNRKEAFARAMKYLEAVKIGDAERVYESFPHELSGGMNQRAMIAMALIGEPELLIADEPTTALDMTVESDIMRLLADIQKERSLSILFITHNLSLAASYAGEIFVMQKGRVVENLKKRDGYFMPKEAYTRKLFAAELFGLKPKSFIEV